MAPRLLSLLTLIESSLSQNEAPSVAKGRPMRTVNFHKGLARLSFNDGSGSILLQGFTLADGQICVKAMLEWAGVVKPGVQSVYPSEGFNWAGAAHRIAEAWMDGPPAGETTVAASAADQSLSEGDLAAAG
ncbi:MAG: hypothetical protein QM760_08270 [Nibricoccus sp.]